VKLTVVTTNPNKAREVREFFGGLIDIDHVPLDCAEFRSNDVGEIAREKARYAYEKLRRPLIVDDTGFYINALNGFPGPYAASVHQTIGNEGIITLMVGVTDRRAYFETAIAFANKNGVRVFKGTIHGHIVPPRGTEGFGFDPIFEWEGQTLAEMPIEKKSRISHRGRALGAFKNWLQQEIATV
jgi:XTP/dITP diphosphohydrolase